jgi:hypothetical protein
MFSVQGQCKPNAIEFIRIAEAPPELAVESCIRLQRYGDFRNPTIPLVWHFIYHMFGILPKNGQKWAKFGPKYRILTSRQGLHGGHI